MGGIEAPEGGRAAGMRPGRPAGLGAADSRIADGSPTGRVAQVRHDGSWKGASPRSAPRPSPPSQHIMSLPEADLDSLAGHQLAPEIGWGLTLPYFASLYSRCVAYLPKALDRLHTA